MCPLKLITFDVTNTIIRVLGSVGKTYSGVASIYGITVQPDSLDKAFRAAYKQHVADLPNFGVSKGITPKQWWDMLVTASFTSVGCSSERLPLVASHLYKYFSTRQGWETIPGAETVLAGLQAQGFTLGVVSNFDERLEKILLELSLRHHFQFVLASAVEKCAKPEPEIFMRALKMAGVTPSECIHVGDDILYDYEGARNVGIHPILCSSKPMPETVNAGHVVQNLTDILPLIKKIAQACS